MAEKALAASKDELESTRSNYEQQMKLLSEHLVTLNEKIMAQVPNSLLRRALFVAPLTLWAVRAFVEHRRSRSAASEARKRLATHQPVEATGGASRPRHHISHHPLLSPVFLLLYMIFADQQTPKLKTKRNPVGVFTLFRSKVMDEWEMIH